MCITEPLYINMLYILGCVRGVYDEPICLCQVLYDARGILEKNRDTFRDDILNMLKDSR